MRAAFAVLRPRLRRRAGLTLALGLTAACAPAAQSPLPGSSDAWKKPGEARPAPAPPAPVWEAYAELKQWPALNAEPFVSLGHQPEQPVDVHVNPESRALYQALVTDSVFPDGSVLAELPHRADGRGYGMRKADGAWRFFELNGSGGLISGGALALCARAATLKPLQTVFSACRARPSRTEAAPAWPESFARAERSPASHENPRAFRQIGRKMSKDPSGVSPVGPEPKNRRPSAAQQREATESKRSETKEAEAKLKKCRGTAN